MLKKPGEYRTAPVHLELPNGEIIYNPPPASEIQDHLTRFFKQLSDRWPSLSEVEVAAFTLWFINWVHPFKNGNGRSARAFCYASLSMRAGYVLPGKRTILELIAEEENDIAYQKALRVADAGYQATGEPNLSALTDLIERLFIQQLESAEDSDDEERNTAT